MSELSEFLPVILGEGGEQVEPSVYQLSKKARNNLVRLEAKRQILEDDAILATGSQAVIIASAQNRDGKYSKLESEEHTQSAERIARVLRSVGIRDIEVVPEATHDLVLEALDNPEVSDLIYVGHSERSNLILDRTVTWRAAAERMTHLKHSIGVLGCATSYKGSISPRFGGLLLPEDGLLYGKHSEVAQVREAGDLTNFYEVGHFMTGMADLTSSPRSNPNPTVTNPIGQDTNRVA